MSEPIAIISSEKISESDFIDFLSKQGADLVSPSGFQGQIVEDDKNIWVDMDETILRHYQEGDRPKEFHLIRSKLSKEPQTSIVVEISRREHSEQLAVKFAAAFARRWNAVVDNSPDGIYSAEEIFELERNGSGFVSSQQLQAA